VRVAASAPSASARPRRADRCLAKVAGERPALERVAVGAHRRGGEVGAGSVGAEERGELAKHRSAGASRLGRTLTCGDLAGELGQAVCGPDQLTDDGGPPDEVGHAR